MTQSNKFKKILITSSVIIPIVFSSVSAAPSEKSKRVFDYWTAERIAKAIPRQMVKDRKGLGYIKRPNGDLIPHGHSKLTQLDAGGKKLPMAKPGGGGNDSTPPSVTHIEPANGAIIGASQRFAANVTDASGVRSVTIVISPPSGAAQSFAASNSSGDVWEVNLSGFTDSSGWSWHVSATDSAKGKGNSTTSSATSFDVDTGSGGGGGGGSNPDAIANEHWSHGGDVQTAVGRIFFEMPTNSRRKRWNGYVCSGTVSTDGTTGRSVIITAAHCVYDDANKSFARNVIFIPNQDGTTGTGTDTNCSNDPLGCWATAFAVVDSNYATRTFPNNSAWDYAYYVVEDSGAHSGTSASSEALDNATATLPVDFSQPFFDVGTTSTDNDFTYGLGYSYSDDPNFMHCADNLSTNGATNWWIPICGMSGGSSGGPWVQPMNTSTGSGQIMSVNSWGYTDGSPGMAGPMLNGTSAQCLMNEASTISFASIPSSDGDAGVSVNYCP